MASKKLKVIMLGFIMTFALFVAAIPQGADSQGNPAGTKTVNATLTSALVSVAPTLDGEDTDAAWSDATEVTITVSGGANTAGSIQVHLKSVYKDDKIYFLAHWTDAQDSKNRFPWVYNTTTKAWGQLGDQTTGDENTYYEDKMAMFWDISGEYLGFDVDGCMITCHISQELHYTDNASVLVDMWHWKRVRNGPVNQIDDQYMDNNTTAAEGGRKSDPKTGTGGYVNNKKTLNYTDDSANSTSVPKYWYPNAVAGDDGIYWVKTSDVNVTAFEIVGVYKSNGTLVDSQGNHLQPNASTQLPGITVSPFAGDRSDISGQGKWASDFWTLEMSRNLDTGSIYDVQFDDTGADARYYFGLSIFQNAQIDHNFHSNVYALAFEQPNNAPGTPTITATPTTAAVGETITFNATATDADGDSLTYAWEFGDGATGTGNPKNHSYDAAGTYQVNVTVSDGKGGSSEGSVSITITEVAGGLSTELLIGLIVVIIVIIGAVAYLVLRKKPLPPMKPEQKSE